MQVSGSIIKICGRSQVNTKNHYPIDDAEIVGDDRSVSKLAHLGGYDGWLRPEICTKVKVIEQTNSVRY
jgi:hypothetical protein